MGNTPLYRPKPIEAIMEQFSDDEVDELRSRFQSLWFFLPLFPLPFSRVVLGALARAGGGFPVINSYEFVYSIRGYSSHFFFLSPCHAFLALFDEHRRCVNWIVPI